MELRAVLKHKRLDPSPPYKPDAWHEYLHAAGLLDKYPSISDGLRFGFNAGIWPISQIFAPLTRLLQNIIQTEFQKDHYMDPVTQKEVELLIGPFQTSPLSIIPKPRRPGKFCIIQNFSLPHSPLNSITSINSSIDSSQYPCTWGTFSVICLLIWCLPPGSQAAVCDVKEAYRGLPIRSEQWPGLVVRLDEQDSFAIDT